jgi:hypothetical protein
MNDKQLADMVKDRCDEAENDLGKIDAETRKGVLAAIAARLLHSKGIKRDSKGWQYVEGADAKGNARGKAEPLGDPQALTLGCASLAAALAVATHKEQKRDDLRVVRITQQTDKSMRLSATNGHTLLVVDCAIEGAMPEWVQGAGVCLTTDVLSRAVKAAGTKDGDTLQLVYGEKHPSVRAVIGNWAEFKIATSETKFPDLTKVIEGGAEALTHNNAVPLEAVVESGLRHPGLADRASWQRHGASVRRTCEPGVGVHKTAMPGALYVMPMGWGRRAADVAAITLAPAVKRLMAALAHATRMSEAAKKATGRKPSGCSHSRRRSPNACANCRPHRATPCPHPPRSNAATTGAPLKGGALFHFERKPTMTTNLKTLPTRLRPKACDARPSSRTVRPEGKRRGVRSARASPDPCAPVRRASRSAQAETHELLVEHIEREQHADRRSRARAAVASFEGARTWSLEAARAGCAPQPQARGYSTT